MSMQYCHNCDRMIDTDYYEFESENQCMECSMELTSKEEDLILARENE